MRAKKKPRSLQKEAVARIVDVAPGERVPGSKYVRAHCPSCKEPMRVSAETYRRGPMLPCIECDPGREPTLSTLCAAASRVDIPEEPLEWDNVVRAWEQAA